MCCLMVWRLCDDKEPLTTVLNTMRSTNIGGGDQLQWNYSSSTLLLEKATEGHFQLPHMSADFDDPEDGPSVSWSMLLWKGGKGTFLLLDAVSRWAHSWLVDFSP